MPATGPALLIVMPVEAVSKPVVLGRHPGLIQDLILDAPSACQNDANSMVSR